MSFQFGFLAVRSLARASACLAFSEVALGSILYAAMEMSLFILLAGYEVSALVVLTGAVALVRDRGRIEG